jgi:hypothetical protein
MKKLIALMLVIITCSLFAITFYTKVFTIKTFPKSSTRTDTSATLNLKGANEIEVGTSIFGTDSAKITTYVDGVISGCWFNLTSNSLIMDNVGYATGYGKTFVLRGNGTNVIPGVEQIRLRNVLQIADDDSTSAQYYNQYIIGR